MKAQAEKAREYLNNRDRLKDLDINIYIRDREQVDEKLAETQLKLETAMGDLAKARETLETTKEEYIAVEKELETIEEKIGHIHRQDEANTLHIEQLNGKPYLFPENEAYAPIPFYTENCRILGKVVGLHRYQIS